jgi:hypothetical protein
MVEVGTADELLLQFWCISPLQIYVNSVSMDYLIRVWGKTQKRGKCSDVDQLQRLCRETFAGTVACVGYLASSHGVSFGDDFMFVDYPCGRQISRTCDLGRDSPNSYRNFIRISLLVSTTRFFSAHHDISDS